MAFADELLFFVTNPLVSIPNLLAELKNYGALSVFKVNYQKSEALNVSMTASLDILLGVDFSFKWSGSYINYLGILLPSRLEDIFFINFPPLLTAIKKDLRSWQKGMFSWLGRCSIIKINIISRLLYHLQALPVWIPSAFLKAANQALVAFIWAHKPPRLAQSIL